MIVNKYQNNNISFEALKYKRTNNIKIPETYPAMLNTKNGTVDCFVKTCFGDSVQKIQLISALRNRELGFSRCTQKNTNTFINNSINNFSTFPGVGSVMHLAQIVTMMENKIDRIELYSLGDAICFHAKLGYKSDEKSITSILSFFFDEIFDKCAYDKRFSAIIEKIHTLCKSKHGVDKIKCGNKIIDEYIQTINNHKLYKDEDFAIITGIDMYLDRSDVIKNKDFYNKLFKKYGIDYQINA